MRFLKAIFFACLPSALCAEFFFAEGQVAFVSHGIQCVAELGEIEKSENTIDGEIIVHDGLPPDHDIETHLVPATLGTSFSVKVRALQDIGEEYLIAVLLHPPMGEDQKEVQWWGIPPLKQGQVTALGYTLEDEFELVPGDWFFRLVDQEEILMQWKFEIVDGPRADEILAECPKIGPSS